MFIYTTEPHPTRQGAILATAPKGGNWQCFTDTELAFLNIGGTHWRGLQDTESVGYTLTPGQCRALDLILRAGFRPASYPWNGKIEPEDRAFWHPEREGEEFTLEEVLAIASPPPRCTGTAEMDFSAPIGEIAPPPPIAVIADEAQEYSIGPARYAQGKLAVRCHGRTGYKTRADRLVGDALNCRWSGRDGAHIASPAQVERFERLFRHDFDASSFTGEIDHDRTGWRNLNWRTADAIAKWLDECEGQALQALTELRGAGVIYDLGQIGPDARKALNALMSAGLVEKRKEMWPNAAFGTSRKNVWAKAETFASDYAEAVAIEPLPEMAAAEPISIPAAVTAPELAPDNASEPETGWDGAGDVPADPVAAILARLDALEAALAAPLPVESGMFIIPASNEGEKRDMPPIAAIQPRRTAAHGRAIRRAWAERKRTRELERASLTACNNQRDSNGEIMRLRTERDNLRIKRRTSAERARRMIRKGRKMAAAHKARADVLAAQLDKAGHDLGRATAKRAGNAALARQRGREMVAIANVARNQLDRAAADLEQAKRAPVYMDEAGREAPDIVGRTANHARTAIEGRERAENALAAMAARAERAEQARDTLADAVEAMGLRLANAEAAVRRMAAA